MKEQKTCKQLIQGKYYEFTVYHLDTVPKTDGGIYLFTTAFTRYSHDLFPFYLGKTNNLKTGTLLINQPEKERDEIKKQYNYYRVCVLVVKDENRREQLYNDIMKDEENRKSGY